MSMLQRIVCIVFIFAVAACSGGGKDDAVKRDFKVYKTQMAKVADMETDALAAHVKATDDKSMNDASYGRFLRETFLPRLSEFYGELTRIQPATEEIIDLHRLILMRVAYRIAGFGALEKSTRTGNAALIEAASARNRESDVYYKLWSKRIDELNKLYR